MGVTHSSTKRSVSQSKGSPLVENIAPPSHPIKSSDDQPFPPPVPPTCSQHPIPSHAEGVGTPSPPSPEEVMGTTVRETSHSITSAVPTRDPAETRSPLQDFTEADLQKMLSANPSRIYVVVKQQVFDVTSFAPLHPGGATVLRNGNGKDMTETFYSVHSPQAEKKLQEYVIGRLVSPNSVVSRRESGGSETSAVMGSSPHGMRMSDIKLLLRQDPERIILILFGDAYDITPMRNDHPGGLRVLLNHNGSECGSVFMRIHGLRARKMVLQYFLCSVLDVPNCVSPLRAKETRAIGSPPSSVTASPILHSTRLIEAHPAESSDSFRYFTFSTPDPLQIVPGGHLKLYSDVQQQVGHYYTPYHSDTTSFSVCIKHYPQGIVSGFFFHLKEGDEVFYNGPFVPAWELEKDTAVQAVYASRRHVVLVAGGTGLSPMYSIASSALFHQSSSVTLICSAGSPADLILCDKIRELSSRFSVSDSRGSHTLSVIVIFTKLSEMTSDSMNWVSKIICGRRLDATVVQSLTLQPFQAVVSCGPKDFDATVSKSFVEAGVCTSERVHHF